MTDTVLYLGEMWTANQDGSQSFTATTDGAVAVKDGKILDVGAAKAIQDRWPDAKRHSFSGIMLPGFIDTHVHFPQVDMMGSYGEELLGWLETYTYPAEERYQEEAYAQRKAPLFFQELLANGTTTAAVYGTSHKHSAVALFEAAKTLGLTTIIGKVSMDREAPTSLLQKAAEDVRDNQDLIETFHGYEDRLYVALTPRFAISCTETLLTSLGELKKAYPTAYVQTHHAENQEEVAYTQKLFPQARHYLDVYDSYGLLGDQTILGHCIYTTPEEVELLAQRQANIAHCPTSNAFLGSGLFPWKDLAAKEITIGLATDVGAGTSLSMWKTMAMAYKIQSLRGYKVSPDKLFYHATLGAAHALKLGDRIGCLAPGYRADFQIIDPSRMRGLPERLDQCRNPLEKLFACMILADDRITSEVFIGGKKIELAT